MSILLSQYCRKRPVFAIWILKIMGNGNAEKVKAEKGTKYRVWNTSL